MLENSEDHAAEPVHERSADAQCNSNDCKLVVMEVQTSKTHPEHLSQRA